MFPVNVRALIVVLLLAAIAFWIARRALAGTIADADFTARRNAWLAITSLAFLSNNFWIFIALSTVVLVLAIRRESNLLALYAFLIVVVPPLDKQVPGFGIVNYLFDLSFPRLLSLVILLPALARVQHRRWMPTDWAILAYIAIQLSLRVPYDTLTNSARVTFNLTLDVILPYYVASRYLRNMSMLRDVIASFAAGATVTAMVAMFEMSKRWLLYGGLDTSLLGHEWAYGGYLMRGEALRAVATCGQAIVLGYVMMLAVMCWCAISTGRTRSWLWRLGALVLVGGAVAAISRGPWVGLVAAILVYLLLGPGGIKHVLQAVTAIVFAGVVLALSPYGSAVVDHLPFVGTVDAGNVTFRQLLLDVSLRLIAQSPWFGVPGYLDAMIDAGLLQDGIVDIVNSYIAIALSMGVFALAAFILAFVTVLWPLGRQLVINRRLPPEYRTMVAALVGTLVGIMIVIATVSSILFVPRLYWLMIGLGVAVLMQSRDQVLSKSIRPDADGLRAAGLHQM